MNKTWRGRLSAAVDLVYPSNIYCICCGSVIDKTRPYSLCDKCVSKFRWAVGRTCAKCGKLLAEEYHWGKCYQCRETEHSFEKGWCCVEYGLHEKNCILKLKYGNASYIASKLSDAMYDRICGEEEVFDLIVPVPMYRKKERKRGYNQASLLAKNLARRMEIPFEGKALVRSRETAAMSRLSSSERQENVEGAFSAVLENRFKGKSILLVDDILTTGSTADACAEALLEVGAQKVYLFVFAAGANVRRMEEE